MRLSEWFRKQPKGTQTAMMWATRVSWATICRAKRGQRVNARSAKAISDFTRGAVSIEALRPVPKKRRRAA